MTTTPNLALTQYATTDTIDWLTQYNSDMSKVDTTAGKLSNLTTTNKTNLVSAINESVTNIGTLASLKTAVKTSTVGAINEVYDTTDNGWISARATLTYASASAPTFVCNTNTDLTTRISVGMKLKLTQTTTKYFFVTAITSTTITLYGGADYVLTNTAITNVYYSVVKSPHGFPQTFNKIKTMTLDRSANAIGSQPVTIGFRPKFLKITAYCPGAGNGFESIGTFDGSYEVCTFRTTLQGNIQNTIVAMHSGGSVFQANASFTDFGFVLTWSNVGSIPAGTVKMLIEIL